MRKRRFVRLIRNKCFELSSIYITIYNIEEHIRKEDTQIQ